MSSPGQRRSSWPLPADDECFGRAGRIPPRARGSEVSQVVLEDHAPDGRENDQKQQDDPDTVEPGKALVTMVWSAAFGGRLAH